MRPSVFALVLAVGALTWAGCGDQWKVCQSGTCQIGGTCYPAGVADPTNACQVCDPTTSATTWTPANGTKCDDGLFCTVNDTCMAGTCAGTARDCSDGIACDGDETCDETAGKCAHGTPTCVSGTVCDLATDHCDTACTGCVISGVCYGDGERNPLDPCQVCNVAQSATAFSNNDGATCDDGLFCTINDTCSGDVCSGTARDCRDGVSCNGDESCNEATDTCDPGTSTCNTDEVCNTLTDACVLTCTGCNIGGVCYGNGQLNPLNSCEVCDTTQSNTAFSNNDGATCDDGLFCTVSDTCSGGSCSGSPRSCDDGVSCNGTESCNEATDTCDRGTTTCNPDQLCNDQTDTCVPTCTGCIVAGVCYGNGQLDPINPCRVCDTAQSTTAFSDNDGATCDDGMFCTVNDTCSGGSCSGSSRSCDDGVSCDGTESCNETTDTCDRGTTTCGTDELCDLQSDTCVETCTGCVIGGVCFGAGQLDPNNSCRVCNPAMSTSAFSDNDGATCDDGLFCTVGDTCGGGTCTGSARDCSDGVACNGAEVCNEATDRCDSGTTTCGIDELCDTTSDTCVHTCDNGMVCGSSCVDTSDDPNNCGGCGNSPGVGDHVCTTSDGTPPSCVGGICGFYCPNNPIILSFTGAPQTITVATCMGSSIHVDVRGAQGGQQFGAGSGSGALGGRVQADLAVSPGDTLTLVVGGAGGNAGFATSGVGGFNGGADGGNDASIGDTQAGGGGGGASDIRLNGVGLANRVIVAGGGGGTASCAGGLIGAGAGGGLTGGSGGQPCFAGTPATGGTQIGGGIGGTYPGYCSAGNGTLGNGAGGCSPSGAGGAGGGLFGGGGGAWGGGAGGSSFTGAAATGVVHTQGFQSGNGQIIISW